jgi:hypothetical protein
LGRPFEGRKGLRRIGEAYQVSLVGKGKRIGKGGRRRVEGYFKERKIREKGFKTGTRL